jgi:hypothetical protein
MSNPCLIAVDPGKHGAIAIQPDGMPPNVMPLGETPYDILTQLNAIPSIETADCRKICFLEQAGGYIGKAQPASRAFTFGHNYGIIEGILTALGFEIYRVRAQKWQKSLSALSRPGEEKNAHKRRLRALALERYPQLRPKITLGTCDALLILSYGREVLR